MTWAPTTHDMQQDTPAPYKMLRHLLLALLSFPFLFLFGCSLYIRVLSFSSSLPFLPGNSKFWPQGNERHGPWFDARHSWLLKKVGPSTPCSAVVSFSFFPVPSSLSFSLFLFCPYLFLSLLVSPSRKQRAWRHVHSFAPSRWRNISRPHESWIHNRDFWQWSEFDVWVG